MCTVSWWRRNGQLSLRFNRDEQRGRPVAEAPLSSGGLIHPRDPQGGGTWLCVDDTGTVHCLLNHYDVKKPESLAHPRSRGELPLLSAKNAAFPIADWLNPREYPPFHLLRIPREGEISHVIWDSREICGGPPHRDLTHWTTSGWNSGEVVTARAALFEEMLASRGLSEETLEAFHFSFDPGQPGRWPRMSRKDARTVSYSEIRVTENESSFCYIALEDHGMEPPVMCRQPRLPTEK